MLSGLGIDQLVTAVPDFKSEAPHINHGDEVPHLDEIAIGDFETLGRVSAKLKWPFWGELGKDSPQIENFAFYSFEKGFVDQITTSPDIGPDDELFAQHDVRFFANQELAVRNLAKAGLWNLVAELLESMEVQRESFSDAFRLEASWYALRSGIATESPWIINADDLSEKMPIIPKHYLGEDINLSQFINTAMAIGWTRPSWDTGDIADLIFGSFEPLDEESVVNAMKLLFRSAAVVGRFDCSFTKSDRESAAALFTPKYIQQLLSALWGEAIAIANGLNPEGGSRNMMFATRESHSQLHHALKVRRFHALVPDAWFLRAESLFNVATEIENLGVQKSYGTKSLHEQSHGESFISLVESRFSQGLYFLDEPEAALSPQRQLEFLVLLDSLVKQDSQLVIATHSPIIMSYPHAKIYSFSDKGIVPIAYEDTEHYRVTRAFLDNPARMLKHLIGEPRDD